MTDCRGQLDCGVRLANLISTGALTYICLLLSLYLGCSQRNRKTGGDERRRRDSQLEGQGWRAVLSGLLLLVHLAELGELVAGHGCWLAATLSLASWISVQVFYFAVQRYDRAGYLGVVSLLYLSTGLSRGVLLYRLLEEIGWEYLQVHVAAFSSALYYFSAFNDMATLFNEMKVEKEDEKCGRRERISYRQESAHWYSRITFFWLVPLLVRGYSRPLELEDLGRLAESECAATQFARFAGVYLRKKGGQKVVSLWKCYFECYWKNFLVGGILKLLGDLVGFVAPLGMAVIVDYVSDTGQQSVYKGKYLRVDDFLKNGYNMAGIIFLSALAQGSFSQASSHVMTVEGIRLKTALQALIYDKALRLSISNKDDESSSDGNIGSTTNLMSEDTFNVMTCFWIGHYTWAIPWKIIVLMYLLYRKLGASAVIGAVSCIIVMAPLQFIIGKKMSDNSKTITMACDERLRQTNELLQGMRTLKLCGWEEGFCARVSAARKEELSHLDKDSLYWAIMTFVTQSSTSVISLVSLAAYCYTEGSSLSPASVFSALALFNQLTVPLFIFPITVPIIISALVSTRRLEDYLSLPETISIIPETSDTKDRSFPSTPGKENELKKESMFGLKEILEETDEGGLESEEPSGGLEPLPGKESLERKVSNVCIIREAGFSWAEDEKPALWVDRLNIPKGKLTVVIGRVGSGKSSFLSALLGEMKSVSGLLKWEKGARLGYVSQTPWLLNASLRENILLGLPYKVKRYERALDAAALRPDLQLLPLRDLTEIGERGVNLSGGQRQRIAIARALYSKANVLILDDPLSSLDYHVAQHVFERGILPLVCRQQRTVIMVTHSLHLLTHADLVVALEEGRVRACGKLGELELAATDVQEGRCYCGGREEGVAGCGVGAVGKTAKERWQLVKLVSRIGRHAPHHSRLQVKPLFIPFRKRLSTTSEFYWTGELVVSEREGVGGTEYRSRSLPYRHRPVARATSLQPQSSSASAGHYPPVTRQCSTPTISQANKSKTYTFEGGAQGGSLLKQIFMNSTKHVPSGNEVYTGGSFKEKKNILKRLMSTSSMKSMVLSEAEKHPIQRLPSTCSDHSDDGCDEEDNLEDDWCGSSSTDERQYGKIPASVYLSYVSACSACLACTYLGLVLSWQAFRLYTDFWLSDWTEESSSHSQTETFYYLTIYSGLSLVSVLISLVCNLLGQYCGARARRRLHKEMLFSIVRLSMSTFELIPLGRILSRFSTDLNVVDKKLATSIQRLLHFLLLCFSAILVNSIVTPWFLIVAVPICVVYYFVQKFYRSSSRELQRLDSMTRTPILSHLTETLAGLETIRAFKQQKRFTAAFFYKLDLHTNAFLITNCATRWLGIALDYLGGVIVLLGSLVSLLCSAYLPGLISPALIGLTINYTLLVPMYLNWLVKFVSDLEMYMSGVERIVHYVKMPPENYKANGYIPLKWPSRGEIRFEGVTLRYDHCHEVAISNLTLHIKPGQKIGICGRTGSGKSSLVMSLFGMTPVIDGSILIDGVDISTVPLQTLRSRLSVIPQDIIMFSGTIRENLDLENRFSDAELWDALEIAQMKETVSSQLGGLNGAVREGGLNLSCGQRQLLCLARAVLHNAVCLVMDEATSCLDPTTERIFQAAVDKAFRDKTVITIAHRLGSLLTCDRILVIESGRLVEDGSPPELLGRSMGIFSTMLRSTERQREQQQS